MNSIHSDLTNSNDDAAATLRTWGELGRQWSRTRPPVVVNWDSASRMIGAAKPYFQALASELNDLLKESDSLFAPLADPLRTDFGAHRWLKGNREESYSDWLAWIVEHLDASAIIDLFNLKQLFPDTDFDAWRGFRGVEREKFITYDDSTKTGRLDLFIRFDNDKLVVVEVKVGVADSSHTDKQVDYRNWLDKRGVNNARILLATDGDKAEYEGFYLLRWADVCLELRLIAKQLLAGNTETVTAAMILAFVGAVEQNLLGYSRARIRQIQRGQCVTFNPAVVIHLKEWENVRNETTTATTSPTGNF